MKKKNGHDPGTSRMIEVLERIEKELTGLRGDVTRLRGEVRGVREELEGFRIETRDELLDLHAEQHQLRMELRTSIDLRLTKLEAAVFPSTGT